MTLFPGLDAGRGSLMAHGTAIGAVSDNLSNANTPGYKSERADFSDIFAQSQGSLFGSPTPVGGGTSIGSISVSHDKQGSVESTARELDFSVQGTGMFVLSNGTQQFYSRNGTFFTDTSGNLVNGDGLTVMGFTATSPTTPVALNVGNVAAAPVATDTVNISANLDASSPQPTPAVAAPASFTELSAASNFSSIVRVYDSLGKPHEISLHYFHTGASTWDVQAFVDGSETGGPAGTPVNVGTGTITFDANGAVPTGTTVTATINAPWSNGAAASAVTVDLSKFTGYASPSAVTTQSSNGHGTGDVQGYELQDDGSLMASLSNGTSVEVGTVALADFINPDGLTRAGDTLFMDTDGSAGKVIIGSPNAAGLGTTSNFSLESSNVDTANEFVGLIQYQRGYQAGSKVITTIDDLISSTLQLA